MTRYGFFSRPVTETRQNTRAVILAAIYVAIIAGSFYVAYEIRFDFRVPLVRMRCSSHHRSTVRRPVPPG